MSESKVTIILTSYNRPHWLQEAIDSVLNQTYSNWELFVIDDNSPGDAVDNLMASLNDDRIHYINTNVSNEDRGKSCRYATNINTVLKISDGTYISYLTDDDAYYPDRLASMVAYLDSNPDISVVYGYQFCFNDDTPEIPSNIRAPIGPLERAACEVDHNSVMHRRSIIDDVGYWDDSIDVWGHADAAFWNKINNAGYKFYSIPEILDKHRFHEQSVQSKMLRGVMPYEVG